MRQTGAAVNSSQPGRGPWLLTPEAWPYLLVPLIPMAVVLKLSRADAVLVFFVSALGIIPTAALMGRATEELAARSGPGIGALLNVTFGNAPELIIAFFALLAGLQEVVKASIIGSIIGNILLVLGAAMFFGGLRRQKQTFSAAAASAQATMLLLALVALVGPAVYQLVEGGGLPSVTAERVNFGSTVEHLSLAVACVLIASYGAGLVFSLRTHRQLFNPDYEREVTGWGVGRSIASLAIAGMFVGVMSEILVGSIVEAADTVGVSQFFVGVIIVAIVGNVAEHWVAVLVAVKNKMDLAVNIAIGSSAQIALFVAPALVLASFVFGPGPMPLVFNGFELAAAIVAVMIANYVTQDGESNWFEGFQLLSVYAILAAVFAFA
jgi:Ca2+:H+ antiporter